MDFDNLKKTDKEIFDVIEKEHNRQQDHFEMIASENYVSKAVMEAMGSELTNKYAEGYPAKRYYGGCEVVDIAENIARDRLCKLFNAEHANVQPHSGANANIGVYFSILKPGDKVLGMNLSEGGHLTHGSPVNISGSFFDFAAYGVDSKTEVINYDTLREIALKEKPKLIVAGASAYPRIIDFKKFREIADEVGAMLMVDMAHIAGLVATGFHPSPVREENAKKLDKAIFPGIQGGPLMHVIAAKAVAFGEALKPEFTDYCKQILANAQVLAKELDKYGFRLISGGTDNHLILIDIKKKGFTGKEAEAMLGEIGIAVNKNTIPNETESPFVTSGIRIGTPALTTRGFKEDEMREVAEIFRDTFDTSIDRKKIRQRVSDICKRFPMYEGIF